ncbi:unnamed protein product, partial [Mesorhabditis belari]|uniref:Uncharacterized protein n=1 Tax=Mesorhabditis belari TaxID=2138241 RepID=A0AAF3ERF7_9BILA
MFSCKSLLIAALLFSILHQVVIACPVSVQRGACLGKNVLGDPCGGQPGSVCHSNVPGKTKQVPLVCCPVVDWLYPQMIIGPAIGNQCPTGYTPVFIPSEGLFECVAN